ncbi:hypothetical protein PYCCODRAFT_1146906 [Trametes coccinea BRFM310]|uniref:Uncharacterized protein n=1 Tax=Trametes coccinea (strain BRFM310) TaxID=1353009 RepID=A0A1Y2I7X8_TRAC3|nr:hypothetical protein PYCCODRAFT_1146906 [Trametes coccinea BRFM310]
MGLRRRDRDEVCCTRRRYARSLVARCHSLAKPTLRVWHKIGVGPRPIRMRPCRRKCLRAACPKVVGDTKRRECEGASSSDAPRSVYPCRFFSVLTDVVHPCDSQRPRRLPRVAGARASERPSDGAMSVGANLDAVGPSDAVRVHIRGRVVGRATRRARIGGGACVSVCLCVCKHAHLRARAEHVFPHGIGVLERWK